MNKKTFLLSIIVLLSGCQNQKTYTLEERAKRLEKLGTELLETQKEKNNYKYSLKMWKYRREVDKYREIATKKTAESLILEGRLLFSMFRFEEAEKVIERAVELEPNNQEYIALLEQTKEAIKEVNKSRIKI